MSSEIIPNKIVPETISNEQSVSEIIPNEQLVPEIVPLTYQEKLQQDYEKEEYAQDQEYKEKQRIQDQEYIEKKRVLKQKKEMHLAEHKNVVIDTIIVTKIDNTIINEIYSIVKEMYDEKVTFSNTLPSPVLTTIAECKNTNASLYAKEIKSLSIKKTHLFAIIKKNTDEIALLKKDNTAASLVLLNKYIAVYDLYFASLGIVDAMTKNTFTTCDEYTLDEIIIHQEAKILQLQVELNKYKKS